MIILSHDEKQWSGHVGTPVVKSNQDDGTFPSCVRKVCANQWGSLNLKTVCTMSGRAS